MSKPLPSSSETGHSLPRSMRHKLIQSVRRRLNRKLALRTLLLFFRLAAAAALLSLFIRKYTFPNLAPKPPVMYLWPAALVPIAAVWLLSRYVSQRHGSASAAQAADRRAGLKDRLTTALEFAAGDAPILRLQRNDTDRAARSVDAAAVVPLRLKRDILITSAVLLLLVAVVLLPPLRPDTARLSAKPAPRTEKAAMVGELIKIIEETNTSKVDLTALQNAADAIKELKKQLERKPLTDQELEAALKRTQHDLRQEKKKRGNPVDCSLLGRKIDNLLGDTTLPGTNLPGEMSELLEALKDLNEKISRGEISEQEWKKLQELVNAYETFIQELESMQAEAAESGAEEAMTGETVPSEEAAQQLKDLMDKTGLKHLSRMSLKEFMQKMATDKAMQDLMKMLAQMEPGGTRSARGLKQLIASMGLNQFGKDYGKESTNLEEPGSSVNGLTLPRNREAETGGDKEDDYRAFYDEKRVEVNDELTRVKGENAGESPTAPLFEIEMKQEPGQGKATVKIRDQAWREFEKQYQETLLKEEIPYGYKYVIKNYFEGLRDGKE